MSDAQVTLLRDAYAAFNARDVDRVLEVMQPDVTWPNGMEGGWVHGHAGVREYWTRQWKTLDPEVYPIDFKPEPDGRISVTVRQVVHDREGALLADGQVRHVYRFRDGLVADMEIRG